MTCADFSAMDEAETWTAPSSAEWAAIAALGAFPMGLALFFWDFGVKRGDIQALGRALGFPRLGDRFAQGANQIFGLVERVDGVLQNVEFDTIKDVSPK